MFPLESQSILINQSLKIARSETSNMSEVVSQETPLFNDLYAWAVHWLTKQMVYQLESMVEQVQQFTWRQWASVLFPLDNYQSEVYLVYFR